MQRRGKVTAKVESWRFSLDKDLGYHPKTEERIWGKTNRTSDAHWASFGLETTVRNRKEIAVEIRTPKFVFGKGRKDLFEIDAKGTFVPYRVMNSGERYDVRLTIVPGEQSKILNLEARIDKRAEEMTKLPACDRVDFMAFYGNSKKLRYRIASLNIEQ